MTSDLIITKLRAPIPQPGTVRRSRFGPALERALQRRLLLLSAPAGFGKTTLIAEWRAATAGRIDFAWVTLDDHDNDPARLWRHALGSIAAARPGAVAPAASQAGGSMARSEAAIAALINGLALAGNKKPLVIVFDDVQAITSPSLYADLAYAIDRLPAGVTFALLTRADPPLPLARLRVRGELEELRAAELSFDLDETRAFLRGALGGDIDPALASHVRQRTEGWPAAIRLAAIAARDAADPPARLRALMGVESFIVEYLTQEVLQGLPAPERDLLLAVSVVEHINAPLCAAITGSADSGKTLARIERAGFFVTALDDLAGWLRFHPLIGQALRGALRRERPDDWLLFCRRACDWHLEQGNTLAAIDLARQAGDVARLTQGVSRLYRALLARGELVTLRRALEGLPPQALQESPRLALAHAYATAYSLHIGELERDLERVEAGLDQVEPGARAGLRVEALTLGAVARSVYGDPAEVRAMVAKARGLNAGEDDLIRRLMHQALGNAARLAADVPAAIAEYSAILKDAVTGHPSALTSVTLSRLGFTLALAGRLREAERRVAESLAMSAPEGAQPAIYAGEALLTMSELRYARRLTGEATALAARGAELAEQTDNHAALIFHARILARTRLLRGDEAGARQAVAQAGAWAAAEGVPALSGLAELHAAWLALVLGERAAIEDWPRRYLEDALRDRLPALFRHDGDILLARAQMALRQPLEAVRRMDALIAEAGAHECVRTVLRARITRALALASAGRPDPARSELLLALREAEPEGWVSVFADEGPAMRNLLVELRRPLVRDNAPAPLRRFVERLLTACSAGRAQGIDMIEAMTPRETEILSLVARGAANLEIAHSLRISQGTVKAHTSRIYGKLGARNRVEAAARARDLGLIPE